MHLYRHKDGIILARGHKQREFFTSMFKLTKTSTPFLPLATPAPRTGVLRWSRQTRTAAAPPIPPKHDKTYVWAFSTAFGTDSSSHV